MQTKTCQERKGFTLTEIFQVFSVISLTFIFITNLLVNGIKSEIYKKKWQSEYKKISAVLTDIKTAYGDFRLFDDKNGKYTYGCFSSNFKTYFLKSNKCEARDSIDQANCYGLRDGSNDPNNFYKGLDGTVADKEYWNGGQVVLKDGTFIFTHDDLITYEDPYIDLGVDVNGYKHGPNVFGKDVFGLRINIQSNDIIPWGLKGSGCLSHCDSSPIYPNSGKKSDVAGCGCSAKYLNMLK